MKHKKPTKKEIAKQSKMIDAAGGTTVVANAIGITPQAVSQWKKNGIPKITLELLKIRGILKDM